MTQTPTHARFNNLCEGDTLDRYEWFEIMPCRADKSEVSIVQCEAGEVEFWTIYGRANVSTEGEPEYLATAIHDAYSPLDIVRVARQIAIETGKGFVAGDTTFGLFPKRIGVGIWPVNEFTEIAEDLTTAIHHDIEATIESENRCEDDFDTHPLAPLREAVVEYSDYSGPDQLDPYQDREAVCADE